MLQAVLFTVFVIQYNLIENNFLSFQSNQRRISLKVLSSNYHNMPAKVEK